MRSNPCPAGSHQFLEARHNGVIAAASVCTYTQAVVDLFPPVDGKDHVRHLTVDKVDLIVRQQKAVGGDCKAEVFVVRLLDATRIGNCFFHHVKVHQRFSAEEIHFQIVARPGLFNQKVDSFFRNFQRHQHSAAAKVSLCRKAIFAAQITIVRNVQAHGFDGSVRHHCGKLFVLVR